MEYLEKSELKRLFSVIYKNNKKYHQAFLIGLWHGARVSEVCELRGTDLVDGQLYIGRKKGSNGTCQPVHTDIEPMFDNSPLFKLAAEARNELMFPVTRQRLDQLMKKYCVEAGIHPNKAHFHVLKHSCAMLLWDETKSLGQIQSYLGHKSASSTMCYLVEADKRKAEGAIAGIRI